MKGIICKAYSEHLHREMEYKVFGTNGRICLAFPTNGGRYYDFENFGLAVTLREWIDDGKLQLVLVDGIDKETIANPHRDARQRIELHEAWYNYIIQELIPELRSANPDCRKLIATGCDTGAYHAANMYFRRPDLFDTVIALSGIYDLAAMFNGYSDDLVYANSPITFLKGMPLDHAWIRLYREGNIYMCAGQGKWDESSVVSTKALSDVLTGLNIKHCADLWGSDVVHDWYWWIKQLPYFMKKVL